MLHSGIIERSFPDDQSVHRTHLIPPYLAEGHDFRTLLQDLMPHQCRLGSPIYPSMTLCAFVKISESGIGTAPRSVSGSFPFVRSHLRVLRY